MKIAQALSRLVVRSCYGDVRQAARHAARRSLVDWLGRAPGGSRHEAVETVLQTLAPFAGSPRAAVIGRRERLDCLSAALADGASARTRLRRHRAAHAAPSRRAGRLHTARAPQRSPLRGASFLRAFILGVDVECRTAGAAYLARGANQAPERVERFPLGGGRVPGQHIEHVTGSVANPMGGRGLERKFRELARLVVP
ncbi:MAG TPA: MmgE/PrpD family protein [Burkholderiales bacterium]|nr:MmgE/PrpD family protein [Burkholderiales bacterium]